MLTAPLKAHPLLRVLLAACIAALLLGDVWRSLHLLHARHVLCPEHGELVDDPGKSPEGDADEALSGGTSTGGGAQALPGGGADHHHEHCGLAAAPSRQSMLAVASAGPSIGASAAGSLLLEPAGTGATSRAVLAYAPKQSPPFTSV
jgi:hypothetical protein